MTGTWASGWATDDVVSAAELMKGIGSIYDTTLGAAAATIDVTGIVGAYAHLLVVGYLRSNGAVVSTSLRLRFNGDGGSNYDPIFYELGASLWDPASRDTYLTTHYDMIPGGSANAAAFGAAAILIPHYAGSANEKSILTLGAAQTVGAATSGVGGVGGGRWESTAAINRITFSAGTGNLDAGSRLTIYAMGA